MLGEATGIPVALPDIRFVLRPPAFDIHSGTSIVCRVGTGAENIINHIGCVTSYSLVYLVPHKDNRIPMREKKFVFFLNMRRV